MTLSETVIKEFASRYHHPPTHIIRAPGRVNLIGEHTDYNDGFVMPLAIDQSLLLAISPRDDKRVSVYSFNLGSHIRFDLADFSNTDSGWSEYIKGTSWALIEHGYPLEGWDGLLASDIPLAAGLSSSAALEMATIRAFEVVSNFSWEPIEMARIGQFAENNWVGVNCGIMDQLIVAVGKRGSAIMIDCQTLEYTALPIPEAAKIVIIDSGTRRGLVESAYNERRKECEAAAQIFGLTSLRDLDAEQFQSRMHNLPANVCRRARHVLTENQRVSEALEAMRANDAIRLGKILHAGHASLRDDFDVSRAEIDALVEIAESHPQCFGARMVGGGFGGSVVSLVAHAAVDDFVKHVKSRYKQRIGLNAIFYVTNAQDGVSVHDLRTNAMA
jgi:galactokinase